MERSSGDTLRRFEHVATLTDTVRVQEAAIKDAINEQGIGGQQVIQGLHEMREFTSGVEANTQAILESSQSVLDQVTELSTL